MIFMCGEGLINDTYKATDPPHCSDLLVYWNSRKQYEVFIMG